MKGTRILRYIGNRPTPEENLWETIDDYVRSMSIPFLLLGEAQADLLKRLGEDKVPDPMFSDFVKQGDPCSQVLGSDGLWLPAKAADNYFNQLMAMPSVPTYANVTSPAPVEKKAIEQGQFEVNLVEPLIGWRAWWVDDSGMLISLNHNYFVWPREKRAEADCAHNGSKHVPPGEACTCGFYAVDSKFQLRENISVGQNGLVVGQMYGWGRYVRGDHGFRCQYAYPKCFYLNDATAAYVNTLTGYRVPIYFEQPMQVYSPSEHGYENGYWENETDGDFRTG